MSTLLTAIEKRDKNALANFFDERECSSMLSTSTNENRVKRRIPDNDEFSIRRPVNSGQDGKLEFSTGTRC